LIVKLAFHLAKVGTLGHHFVNAEKIIAHSDLLEILKICKWLLKQDHWTFRKIMQEKFLHYFLGIVDTIPKLVVTNFLQKYHK
jgi:hemerythrin superfamily protein